MQPTVDKKAHVMRPTPASIEPPPTEDLQAFRPKLHRYCARMIGSAIDAEDIVQEVYVIAHEKWPEDGVRNAEAWLMKIAHNKSIDHLRRLQRQRTEPIDGYDAADPEPAPYDTNETVRFALSVFLQLTPLQRSAVILKDVLDYSLAEISELLNQSTGSVKTALFRARNNLKSLAKVVEDEVPVPLERETQAVLEAYALRFRNRDIAGIQSMLRDDVRLDLVAKVRAEGKDRVAKYFGNYASLDDWSTRVGQVEGHPALHIDDGSGAPFLIVLDCRDEQVASIRDFHFVRYISDSACFQELQSTHACR